MSTYFTPRRCMKLSASLPMMILILSNAIDLTNTEVNTKVRAKEDLIKLFTIRSDYIDILTDKINVKALQLVHNIEQFDVTATGSQS